MNDCSKTSTAEPHGTGMVNVEINGEFKRDIDVYEAYCQVDIKGDIKIAREFQQWFEIAATLSRKFGIEPSIPMVVGRQEHRRNMEATTCCNTLARPPSYPDGHLFQP